jgi:hypothetical protein
VSRGAGARGASTARRPGSPLPLTLPPAARACRRNGNGTALPAGLTYPEFVLENAPIKTLKAVRVPMGEYA